MFALFSAPGFMILSSSDLSFWQFALGLLSGLLLLSGFDDFVPVLICLRRALANRKPAQTPHNATDSSNQRRIAIFVPCWKESEVLENMVRHNLAAIRYFNFDFFLGVYPNDQPTIDVATSLSESFSNVHVALCPEPGPTSKADCLNSVYSRMCRFEVDKCLRFDTIVLHDAEDVIHPEALGIIHAERQAYAMVQVPVLPLPTPFLEFTHAIYCDEFAEFQTIDMRAREYCGSFVPSNGVGTGFARDILEQLARERNGCIFDPASLTEDYEIGVYIHNAGYRQHFAPLRRSNTDFIATREYFPMRVRSAIRQRTRWVTGIALQCWERVGWRGSGWTRYWFWRDRKGLVTNPLSLLTNVVFVAGVIDWFRSMAAHRPWAFAVTHPEIVMLCWATLVFQCFRLTLRMACVGRLFGYGFAAGVPLRSFHGNFINCCATFRAVWRYVQARLRKNKHVWLKTEHAYPSRGALQVERRPLAAILLAGGFMPQEQLRDAQKHARTDRELADHLLSVGAISQDDLCRALSLQSASPAASVDVRRVRKNVARALPAHVERQFGIVPFQIQAGRLHVAGSRVPSPDAWEDLKKFTPLAIEFRLVTDATYVRLRTLLYD